MRSFIFTAKRGHGNFYKRHLHNQVLMSTGEGNRFVNNIFMKQTQREGFLWKKS